MKAILAGGVAAVGIGMAIVGGMNLSAAIEEKPFHFQTASAEAQKEFLQTEATKLAKVMKAGLISKSGVGPTLSLGQTKFNVKAKKIDYTIRVNGASGVNRAAFDKLGREMKAKACPSYVKSQLGKNDIRIVQTFVGKGKKFGAVTFSNVGCKSYI